MRTRLATLWDSLRSSYWFVPLLMVGGAVVLGIGFPFLDELIQAREWSEWSYSGGPAGARVVLSTIAGSMITVAGVTFSITIVALALASSQFGPRLLRNFMRDRGNQIVLGTFIATFSYCLLVLSTVQGEEVRFVPHFSITLALVLAAFSIGVLIYFIHHVAAAIQVDNVIAGVCVELDDAVRRLLPETSPDHDPQHEREIVERIKREVAGNGRAVLATASGYLQAVDYGGLEQIASTREALIRVDRRAGEFIIEGTFLASISPAEAVDSELADQIHECFILGSQRTPVQDIEFSISQLVEVAVRALSPGINDPFTAMACVDRLGAAIAEIAGREDTSGDDDVWTSETPRVITRRSTFAGIADAAFNQIRQYGRSSVAVSLSLLETIAAIAPRLRTDYQREALRRHASMIHRDSLEQISEEDRKSIEERYRNAFEALRGGQVGERLPT